MISLIKISLKENKIFLSNHMHLLSYPKVHMTNNEQYLFNLKKLLNQFHFTTSTILDEIFYKNLFIYYKKQPENFKRDLILNQILNEYRQFITLRHLQVKERFQLCLESSPFEKVITFLKQVDQKVTIQEKLECIFLSINSISLCVKEYYKKYPQNLTDDDLIV